MSNPSSTSDTIPYRTVSESSSISEYDWPTLSDRPRLRSLCDSSAVSISSSRTNSESYDDSLSAPEVNVRERSLLQDDTQSLACGGTISSPVEELTQQLREMFPGKCITDIQSSLKSNSNDMEKAVEWLLSDSQTTNPVLTSHKKHRPVKGSNITIDLTAMKSMKSKRSSNRLRKKSNSQSNEDGYSAEDGLEMLPAADVRALIVDKWVSVTGSQSDLIRLAHDLLYNFLAFYFLCRIYVFLSTWSAISCPPPPIFCPLLDQLYSVLYLSPALYPCCL